MTRWASAFTPREWLRLSGFGGVVGCGTTGGLVGVGPPPPPPPPLAPRPPVGVFVGIVMLGRDGSAGVVGKTLVVFGLACMVVAGVVLATTGRRYWTAAAIQFVPAALALALTVAA